MFLVDSHCHLNYFDDSEIVGILARCEDNGVHFLHNVCVEIDKISEVSKFCRLYPNIRCSIGHHPCSVIAGSPPSVADISSAAIPFNDCIISVGETGLDYFRSDDSAQIASQKQSLINHIEFARMTGRSVIFHVRSAEADFVDIVESLSKESSFGAVMHCFSGSKEFLFKMLDLGFFISLSGIVTFKNASVLQDIARLVPLDRLLIETDAPYLAPQPLRGKKNEPSFLLHTAQFLSENIFSISLEDLANQTRLNFENLFGITVS